MAQLILYGLLAGAFFSSTFVINELMSSQGGHWLWSGCLRFGFMILFLSVITLLSGGLHRLKAILQLFVAHWRFWVVSGGIGFGAFYALVCFAADHSPGWMIATTWQFTIVASLFVLLIFGRSFPGRVWLFSLMIFCGVVLVNVTDFASFDPRQMVMGGLPVLIVSFCYPLGNQLVWEAVHGSSSRLPQLKSSLMDSALNKVMLMSLGSLPVWGGLLLLFRPPPPAMSQLANTALVAICSGLIATSIFLYARNRASTPAELAGVDATQASEVIFALAGGLLLLDTQPPTMLATAGIAIVILGLLLFLLLPGER